MVEIYFCIGFMIAFIGMFLRARVWGTSIWKQWWLLCFAPFWPLAIDLMLIHESFEEIQRKN